MLLIPAIDLKDGQCVRLEQGEMSRATVFSDAPEEMARHWVAQGARRLHLVDLNGAFAGEPINQAVIAAIVKSVGGDIPVQIGGGIRDIKTIQRYIDMGISYVIIGTAAIKNAQFLEEACKTFPGKVIVGLDAKNGFAATDGWAVVTEYQVADLAKKFENYGVNSIIYTDIGRDGMLRGVNIEATVDLAQASTISVIASGGLSSMSDIDALCEASAYGVAGVICGRAIYSGDLDFAAAQNRADELMRKA